MSEEDEQTLACEGQSICSFCCQMSNTRASQRRKRSVPVVSPASRKFAKHEHGQRSKDDHLDDVNPEPKIVTCPPYK
jgi:hypothetical protein